MICKQCILPTSFPNVSFEDGICHLCRDHELLSKIQKTPLGENKLREILTSREIDKYHCLVPISGGKDSSYILFYIVKKLGLKPLAASFDSGFVVDMAKRNVAKICKDLEVDLVIGRASLFREKSVKEAMLASRFLGKFVANCANCENSIRAFAINEAVKRNISFIIWGSSDFEDLSLVDENTKTPTFREHFGKGLNILKKINRALRLSIGMLRSSKKGRLFKAAYHYFRHLYYCIRDNLAMNAPEGWKKLNPYLQVSFNKKGAEVVYFFDYIAYDPHKMIEILKKEMNWEAPVGREAKMDCKLHCLVNYKHLKETGITAAGFLLSTLVRCGLLNRNDALAKENNIKGDLKSECNKICEELGIDMDI